MCVTKPSDPIISAPPLPVPINLFPVCHIWWPQILHTTYRQRTLHTPNPIFHYLQVFNIKAAVSWAPWYFKYNSQKKVKAACCFGHSSMLTRCRVTKEGITWPEALEFCSEIKQPALKLQLSGENLSLHAAHSKKSI